jgi:uncharacterized protein (UPF0210 family)
MRVRALTGFLETGWPLEPKRISHMATCLKACRQALEEAGYEVQTLRIATPPPAEMNPPVHSSDRRDYAQKLEAECFVNGIDYAAIGPALPSEPSGFEIIPEVLGSTENVFASGIFADPESGLSLPCARACAQIIHECATKSPDGFTNLRFAALANVPAGAPFFPAAYHRGGPPGLAIATESADEVVKAVGETNSLSTVRKRLVQSFEHHAATLARLTQHAAQEHDVRFLGVDLSLAPFPEPERSVGTAVERLGVPAFGQKGTATVIAYFAESIELAQFPRTGFCGVLLPVLEDAVLAERAKEGALNISDLLLYATLCGTGLDTIPLPGETRPEALTALILDLGALALRHDKPLTARLMPIPGKKDGDEVSFDFPYFADSGVMSLPASALTGHLDGSELLDIRPRHP